MASNPLDPACFDSSRTSAELRGMVEQLEATMPRPTSQPRTAEAAQAARRDFEESPVFSFAPPSPRAEERTIPGPAGALPLRIFRPRGEARAASKSRAESMSPC